MIPKMINGETEFDRDRRVFFDAFPGMKTFQLIDDKKDRGDKSLIRQFHVNGNVPARYIARMEELNDLGASINMAINETNGKGKKAEHVVMVRSCFADFDDPNKKLPEFKIQPSMVVESSPGKHHVYFFSDNIPLEGFRQLQEGLAYKFNSDPNIKDLARSLRVPGFNHHKAEPFLTRIVSYTGLKYDFGLLTEMFPPKPKEKWSAPKWQPKNDQYSDGKPFTGSYGSSSGNRNCDLAKIIGGMKKANKDWGYITAECFKHNACSNPPLSDAEVRDVLKSMSRY